MRNIEGLSDIAQETQPVKRFKQIVGRVSLSALVMISGTIGAMVQETIAAEDNVASADTGGYPWADAQHIPQPPAYDNITWGYTSKSACDSRGDAYDCNGETLGGWSYRDQWGYDLRNCTSYAAWRAAKEFGVNLAGWGNADTWDDRARSRGYTVDNSPESGDLAIWDSMHVAFVEEVDGNGNARVSEYNQRLDGNFRNDRWVRADHYIDINGTGINWTNSTTTSTASVVYARSETTKAADFNGDQFDDLFAASARSDPAQNEQVFRGSGWLGGGELWATPPSDMVWYADSINLTADIDGDNKDDLISISNNAGDNSPNIFWQRSNGGSFESPQHVGTPSIIGRNTRWAVGDVTGDGYDDIIAFSKREDVGTNMFVFRSLQNWLGGLEYWGATGTDVPFIDSNFLPGDKDGDGKVDLYAVAKHDGRTEPFIYWLKSNGQNFESPILTAVPGIKYEDAKFTSADFSGDGKSDLLASTKRSDTAPNLSVYLSDGGSSYSSVSLWSAPGELRWTDTKFVPADLDKDGDKDLLAIQNYNGTNPGIYWLKSNNFQFEAPVLVGVPDGRYDQMKFDS